MSNVLRAPALLVMTLSSLVAYGAPASASPADVVAKSKVKLPQLSAAQPLSLNASCESLAYQLSVDNTVMDSIETVAKGALRLGGKDIDEHCLLKGNMHQRVSDVDGKSYAIGFEMRMPKNWNGRFLYQANGGLDGAVRTALGALGGGALTGALSQGFVVISSDAGHSPGIATFGYDPQARLDYGYQAVAKLTPMAKSVIAQVYGKAPDRSYFAGCSNGGRHAMVAATRYGDQYDGILVGAPGYRLPLAAVASVAGAQVYASVPGTEQADLSQAFTQAERTMVANNIAAKCDLLDGAKDGMIQHYRACQRVFDMRTDVATCTDGRNGSCLTEPQKTAVETIFDGVKTRYGKRIYSSFPYDVGINNRAHMSWEYTAPIQRDSAAVAMIFNTPPVPLENYDIANFDSAEFVFQANIDQLVDRVNTTEGVYAESAMSFMMPPKPEDMSTLRDRGGKIMVYHGVSDAIFSVLDTQAWYKKLMRKNRGHGDEFAQFYPIPGMGHCSGGPATDQFDMLTPLVAWVEQGVKPKQVLATARGAGNLGGVNNDLPEDWSATRTRPLCPYPHVAMYDGKGDVESASSFHCTLPKRI